MALGSQIYQDAEQDVLGALIAYPAESAAEIFDAVQPEDFINADMRHIFEAARALYEENLPLDRLSVAARAGEAYRDCIRELELLTVTSTMYPTAVRTLRECSCREKTITLAQELLNDAQLGADPEALRGKAEQLLDVLDVDQRKRAFSMSDLLTAFYGRLGVKRTYLDWGYDHLNRRLCTGARDYVILAARPSVGKTAFALNLAMHFAKKRRVDFFSLETDEENITDRFMAAESDVSFAHIKQGETTEPEMLALLRQKDKLKDRQFQMINAAGFTVDQIRRRARRDRAQVVIIDYIGLIRGCNPRQSEYDRITETSMALQRMAKDNKITVIALSQLSRGGEDAEPELSDLRSSGQLEQDADAVLFLYRPLPSDLNTEEERRDWDCLRVLKIGKNKDGVLGKVRFWFNGDRMRFLQTWDHFYDTATTDMPPDPPPEQMRIGGKAV